MKAADLPRATALAAELDGLAMVAGRLAAGEPLRITVGAVGSESEIVVSAGWLADLRATLLDSLETRQERARAALRGLGVDG